MTLQLSKDFTDNLFIFASANPLVRIEKNLNHQPCAMLIEDSQEDFKDYAIEALMKTKIKINA